MIDHDCREIRGDSQLHVPAAIETLLSNRQNASRVGAALRRRIGRRVADDLSRLVETRLRIHFHRGDQAVQCGLEIRPQPGESRLAHESLRTIRRHAGKFDGLFQRTRREVLGSGGNCRALENLGVRCNLGRKTAFENCIYPNHFDVRELVAGGGFPLRRVVDAARV